LKDDVFFEISGEMFWLGVMENDFFKNVPKFGDFGER
jgi:hypothetical protein